MAPNLRPDPGGVFASDQHRRVLAYLPTQKFAENRAEVEEELRRRGGLSGEGDRPAPGVYPQIQDDISFETLVERMREFDSPFTGDLSDEDIHMILLDHEANGHAQQSGDARWEMTDAGHAALTSGQADEPPPLEGERLEIAEKQDALLQKEWAAALDETPQPPNFDPEA